MQGTPPERDGEGRVHVIHQEHVPLVDRLLAPYFLDMALWPVTLVLLAHVVLGIAIAGLEAWRGGMGFGAVAVTGLAGASLACWVNDARGRRFGVTSRALVASWVVGAACAIAADRYGLY